MYSQRVLVIWSSPAIRSAAGSTPLCSDRSQRVFRGAVLFTDLDKLEMGDEFYLHVLDEILAYKVDRIKVVEPNGVGRP